MSEVNTAPVEGAKPEVTERLKKNLFGQKEPEAPQVSSDAPVSDNPTEEVAASVEEEGTGSDQQAEQDDGKEVEAAEPSYTAVINGKSEELPVSKLVALAQQGADYTQKTQVLATERKQVEATKAEVSNLHQTLAHELGVVRQIMSANVPTPEAMNATLQAGDTAKYLQMQQQVNQMNMLAQRQQALLQAQQQQQAQEYQARLESEQTTLVSKLPEYAKPEAHNRLKTYLTSQGWTPEEVGTIADHRAILAAHKAMLWDELQAKSAATQKKIEAAPVLSKPVARQGASAAEEERFKQAKTSFIKAGTVRDMKPADRATLAKRFGIN